MIKLRKHQQEAIEAMKTAAEGIIHLPTGTGKTYIQAYTIIKSILEDYDYKSLSFNDNIPVYVTLAPRIILSNQLYSVVKNEILENKLDCQYLIVHSGRADNTTRAYTKDLPYREITSTTRSNVIREEYERAKREKVPLIIFGTYDSAERIVNANIPVKILMCDEAQYLVSTRFGWIPLENESNKVKQFNAGKKFYFTATLKETMSDNGLGMNNSNLFGPILYKKTPLEMINAGEIIRPRLHLVDVTASNSDEVNELTKDVNAIINGYIEHRAQCNIGAKMLVITKGSVHLNDIVNHEKMKKFLATRPHFKVFDISSAHQPRINGEVVKRGVFLDTLQGMDDRDEAIILHIDILSEGIDVPGITGVMPMNFMGIGKFLQNTGRATRLYEQDRKNLYNNIIKPSDVNDFVKPYAWIIIPVYSTIGEDLKDEITHVIYSLRESGFNAKEDVYIKENKGSIPPVPIGSLNKPDKRAKSLFDIIVNVTHLIEEKEIADKLAIDEFRENETITNFETNELINILS